MIAATGQPRSTLCTACFSGQYPIELPPEDRRGKMLLEQPALPGMYKRVQTGCEPGPDSEFELDDTERPLKEKV